jgi:hypothetical protein
VNVCTYAKTGSLRAKGMLEEIMRLVTRWSSLGWAVAAVAAMQACGSNHGNGTGGEGGNGGSETSMTGNGGTSSVAGGGSGGVEGGTSGSANGGTASGGGLVGGGSGGSSVSSEACVPDYGCKPKSPNTGDVYADCVARVNQFRACVCLPPLARWSAGEACADQDAKYDAGQNIAHAGFTARICSAGNAQDECPGWSGSGETVIDGCLQMMFNEGPPPTSTCTGQCYTDHGHYINMTGTKYKSGVACGFYTMPSGAIWAAQNFL